MSSQSRRSNDQASKDVARLTEEVCELRCKAAELEGQGAGHGSSEQSTVEFRSIFERVGVGLGLADIQGRFLKTNRAFEEMLGYKSGELEGKNINEVTHPDDIAKTQSSRRQTIGREKPFYRLEKRYLAKDGQTIWAQITSTPNFGPDEEFLYTMAVVEDITARREAEAALQRSESRLAEAQRVTNTGSWERDLATDEEFWSAQQYRIFGCDNRAFKVTNQKFLEFVHPEDVARVQAENDRLGAAGGDYDLTFRIVRKDGVERIVRSRGAMVKNAEGQHERTVGTMTDITDYHLAEQAMADSEGRFRAIFEGAPSGMIISSPDGVFQQCNPASGRLLGYSVDELVGKHFSEITHPDDRADNIHLSDRLIVGDISKFDMEKRFLRKDSSILWAHLSVSMTREISGRPRSRIAIVEDISVRKEALAALTHRLLAFSRRQRLQPSLIDMNELVADMIDMLRRTLGETVEVNIRAAENLWLCEVDRPQLENSLLNLAINARDAMAGGGTLLIETANCELDAEFAAARTEVTRGLYVLLSVSDDGAGIPGEALDHVFEPFFTTKEVGKGSGLGLSMVYGFVKQSGGHVEIESTSDEGTRIKIFLPRAMALAASDVEQPAPTIRAAKGERVLLVEDDAEVRDLTFELLKDMGHRVVAADTAKTAMARLEKDSGFDLLLTDIVLPGGVNGVELSHRVHARIPQLKIVYMTGYADDALRHQALPDERANYLAKPFRKAELSAALEKALRDDTSD
jgi:PAS domain S-box-containing protein